MRLSLISSIKKYFKNRRQWGIETEKIVTRTTEKDQIHWSEIMEERICRAENKIRIDKNSEIKELKDDILLLKEEIKKLRKADIKVEKLKNELKTMILHLDSNTNRWTEFGNRISIQLGMDDSLIRRGEKLLNK